MDVIFSELILKDKSKSIKLVMCYILSQNILIEKYQVIILFPWNPKRVAVAISRSDYSAGSICKTQHHPELHETAPLLA